VKRLIPCSSCHRHRLTCEQTCPFYGGTLPACKVASPKSSRARVSRATLFATGAALLGGAACDNGSSMPVSTVAAYGGPGIVTHQDAGADASDQGDVKTGGTRDTEDAQDGGAESS